MKPILGRFTDIAYALMRVVAGLLFAQHGAQKLFGVLGGTQMLGEPLMVAAGVIELVAGLLVAIGLLASIAAFVAAGEMAVAYFMVHAPQGFWPIVNKGELAALYCFVFIYVAARGAGRWSVESQR
jgi:putative oxidoreductase